METDEHDRAVELLKELGMKTYEAECFAALNSVPSGTAREISELADVPRTRVYDATESLAEQGFVEVQHTNPQRFRAIPLSEAVSTMREQYELRVERLHEALAALESDPTEGNVGEQEVWALSSDSRLTGRVTDLFEGAESEVVAVVCDDSCWSSRLDDAVEEALDRGVDVRLGTLPSVDLSAERINGVETVESDFEWLQRDGSEGSHVGRVVLVDRDCVVLSTLASSPVDAGERAVVAEGASNAVVVLWRRLLTNRLGAIPAPT